MILCNQEDSGGDGGNGDNGYGDKNADDNDDVNIIDFTSPYLFEQIILRYSERLKSIKITDFEDCACKKSFQSN